MGLLAVGGARHSWCPACNWLSSHSRSRAGPARSCCGTVRLIFGHVQLTLCELDRCTEDPKPGDAFLDWRRRTDLLIPPGTEAETFSASRLFAATYPEAVSIAELIGSLRWCRLAARGPSDQALFSFEIGKRLGLRYYKPTVLKDPVSHWIEHDCWQPPSLPSYDFRSGKTFGGPAGFRRQSKDADAKRRTAAYWFVQHNRGGDAMLHHRTLNPVIIRDWSTKMELFTSALALTATTSTESHNALNLGRPQTPKAFKEFAFSSWFRPEPQPSTYLYTAPEPVPWPEQDHRPPTGGRPLLAHERQALSKSPIRINPLRSGL